MTCELCLAAGGRFNANRECCQLRHIAGLPPAARDEAFMKVLKDHGFDVMQSWKEKVRAEWIRLREIRKNNALAGGRLA